MPSGSLEAPALKVTAWFGPTGLGLSVNDAVGGRLLTTRVRVVVAVTPSLSVTRRPIVKVPAVA